MSVNINDFQIESEPPSSADTVSAAEQSTARQTGRPDDLERTARALLERAARLFAD
jgi:hypothetical protein